MKHWSHVGPVEKMTPILFLRQAIAEIREEFAKKK